MFHPKIIMFMFETSVPKSETNNMCVLVNNVHTLPTTVDTIMSGINSVKSRLDTMEDRMSALKQAGGVSGYGRGGSG